MASPTASKEVTPPPPVIVSKVTFSTPIKRSLQGSQHFYSGAPLDAAEFQDRMAQELRKQWVGPMPIADFLKTFLPLLKETVSLMPTFAIKHFDAMSEYTAEKDMYDPFIELVNSTNAMPGFKLLNTSVNFDPSLKDVPGMKSKPDVSCYKNTVDTTTSATKYEDIELIFEFKSSNAPADPFNDPKKSEFPADFQFENNGELNTLCRGQIACYARTWMAQQHRTHCFMIWIGGPHARIIRLDRSGGVVSEKFHYESNGSQLLEFLWQFSVTNDAARGMDPTVMRASLEETKLAKDKLYKWKRGERSVYKLKIFHTNEPTTAKKDSKQSNTVHEVLVWGPLADPQSVTGRATRGYPALDIASGKVVFVKDSWRSNSTDTVTEVEILRDLNSKEVCNVPKILYGSDLPGQTTITHAFAGKTWNAGSQSQHFVERVHTRFAEDCVGEPLYRFQSSRQFLQVVYDAFLAHRDAYEQCGILHRDISAGNILIGPDGRGFLNDWDLARYVEKDDKGVHHPVFRSGTWQFMSRELLKNCEKIHTVEDDLESFFWLVLYHALRYMKHDKISKLPVIMTSIFDQCNPRFEGDSETGGEGKLSLLVGGSLIDFTTFTIADDPPITYFIRNVKALWTKWHLYAINRQYELEALVASEEISIEEASRQIPFDSGRLQLHNHAKMVSIFDSTLSKENWPLVSSPLDYLSRTEKRGRSDNIIVSRPSDSQGSSKRRRPLPARS